MYSILHIHNFMSQEILTFSDSLMCPLCAKPHHILEFLRAHLDAIALLVEHKHPSIFTPLPKGYAEYLPRESDIVFRLPWPTFRETHTKKQLEKIGRDNWKHSKKARKRMLALLKKYHLQSSEWEQFFYRDAVNLEQYQAFLERVRVRFDWHDPHFTPRIDLLKTIDWDSKLVWMGILLEDYTRYEKTIL